MRWLGDGCGIQYIFSSCLREMCEIVAHYGQYDGARVCGDVWDRVSGFLVVVVEWRME